MHEILSALIDKDRLLKIIRELFSSGYTANAIIS